MTSGNAVRIQKLMKGKTDEEVLSILSTAFSISYDMGARSIIKIIKKKGLITDVKTQEGLFELSEDILKSLVASSKDINDIIDIRKEL